MLDLRVSGIISKKDCERKYANINQELEIKKSQLEELNEKVKSLEETKNRLNEFRESISKHKKITEFQKDIFESTVYKVIVGGFDDNGKADSNLINIVFKSQVSNKDYIGKFNIEKTVKLTDFETKYKRFIFETDGTGSKSKKLLNKVKVMISLNVNKIK